MHPIALDLGWQIRWYGILVALGFLFGFWTASRRAPLSGIHGEKVLDSGLWLLIGSIVGARFLYVISYWDNLMANPLFPNAPWTEIFMVQRGGLVYYGGLIGASLACIAYCRVHKVLLFKFADILTPSIALGSVFGRLGCFMNGCCYGRVCDLPWAVRYPHQSDVWQQHFKMGIAEPNGASAPVHPTQIYDSLLNLGLYFGLSWLYRRKKFDGQVFAVYLLCYAIMRSFVEYFRGDYTAPHMHGGLTPAHLVSIGIFVTGIIFYVVLSRRQKA